MKKYEHVNKMINIPKQLSNCRFIKTNGKIPVDQSWTTINNFDYNSFSPIGDTYGVATGFNKLVVIDCDKKYIQDKLLEIEIFRKTFTVKTATKRLYHFYMFVDIDNPKSFSMDDKNGERIIDLQAQGKMVVGPNSKLSTGNSYEIVNDFDIQIIPYSFLKNILLNIDDDVKFFSKEDKSDIQSVYVDFDDICTKIKERLTVKDILIKAGINAEFGKNCKCPLGHTSEGGKCFSFTKQVWYCFHCYQTGNIFHLYMKIKNINFIDAKRQLSNIAGLTDNVTNQILLNYADKKTRHIASEQIAYEFMKLYKVYTIREDDESEIYIYREGIYVPEGKSYIKEFIRDILENLYNESFVKNVIDKIIVDSFILKERFFIDEDVSLVPLQNGILNLNEMKLMDFSPEYKFFTKLPLVYDPTIKADKSISFIRDIVKNESDIETIQEMAGYLLYRDAKFEKSFMLLGSGRNGKSKLIELFTNLVGYNNTIEISLSTLENDNFAISNFYGKYANFSPDISKEALEYTGNFKSLVGRDMMTANRKFKTPIMFRNFAKMIFAANTLPTTSDITSGFFDKWIILDFPYKFVENPVEPYEKKKDMDIMSKIINPKEMSGFLNWALEGLFRLLKNRQFSKHNSTEEVKIKWITESNTFAKFWYDEIIMTENLDDTIKREDLMVAYDEYCLRNGLEKEGNKKIYNFANQNSNYKRIRINGELEYILRKVKFKTFIPKVEVQSDMIIFNM